MLTGEAVTSLINTAQRRQTGTYSFAFVPGTDPDLSDSELTYRDIHPLVAVEAREFRLRWSQG